MSVMSRMRRATSSYPAWWPAGSLMGLVTGSAPSPSLGPSPSSGGAATGSSGGPAAGDGAARPPAQPLAGRARDRTVVGRPQRRLPGTGKDRLALQFGQGEVVRHLTEDLGQRGFQRTADRREKFRGRLLLAALDFGQVAQGHPGRGGHLAE